MSKDIRYNKLDETSLDDAELANRKCKLNRYLRKSIAKPSNDFSLLRRAKQSRNVTNEHC